MLPGDKTHESPVDYAEWSAVGTAAVVVLAWIAPHRKGVTIMTMGDKIKPSYRELTNPSWTPVTTSTRHRV